MNATPFLVAIAGALEQCRLEAVMIGNGAAALQGAPVTTLDFDFMFRKTPLALKKMKEFADSLEATIMKPYYPSSDLFRVVNDDTGLQVDFMGKVHGVRSFAGLKARAGKVQFAGALLLIADLRDIIKSKRAADRPRDRAVMEVLEKTLREKEKSSS